MRLEATALLLFSTALLLLSYGALTSASTSKAYQSAGTKKMAARLDEIIRSTRIEESPYMNREKAQAIQRLLRSTLDQRVGLKLRVRLVQELLLAGDTEDALKQLRDIRDIADDQDSREPGDGEVSGDVDPAASALGQPAGHPGLRVHRVCLARPGRPWPDP